MIGPGPEVLLWTFRWSMEVGLLSNVGKGLVKSELYSGRSFSNAAEMFNST